MSIEFHTIVLRGIQVRLASLWSCSSAYVTRPRGTGKRFNVKAASSLCKTEPPWAAYLPLSFQPSAIPLNVVIEVLGNLSLKAIQQWIAVLGLMPSWKTLVVQGRTECPWSHLALGFQWLLFPSVVHVPVDVPVLHFWTLQRLRRYVGRRGMIWSHWPKLDALFPSKNLLILQTLVLSYRTCREICS